MVSLLKVILDTFKDMLYPKRCPICDGVINMGESGICDKCHDKIKVIKEPVCKKCGRPVDDGAEYCLNCEKTTTSYVSGRCILIYDKYLRHSISLYKYHGRVEFAETYAIITVREAGEWIRNVGAQAFVPVPLHPERMYKRGYNQAEVLAQEISGLTGVPTVNDLLIRVKKTQRQKELDVKQRKNNLSNAFKINDKYIELNEKKECVIIVDDIYTTGSTVEACATVLKAWGVNKIFFLCLCAGVNS